MGLKLKNICKKLQNLGTLRVSPQDTPKHPPIADSWSRPAVALIGDKPKNEW